jgi:hypothetical protein
MRFDKARRRRIFGYLYTTEYNNCSPAVRKLPFISLAGLQKAELGYIACPDA